MRKITVLRILNVRFCRVIGYCESIYEMLAMTQFNALATGENPKIAARSLYWQGWSITAISEMVGQPRTTVDSWKKADRWDEAKPLDRVEGTLEARMVQLIWKTVWPFLTKVKIAIS